MFNNLDLEVLEYKDTWSLSNKQVAEGFGVSEEAIRSQKARNEFKEGVHFYLLQNATGNAMQTFWTKKGVITLGFKLKETPQTIAFRDWASDYILSPNNRPTIQELLDNPRSLAELALRYADTLEQNKLLEAQAVENKPYIAYAKTIEVSKGDLKIGDYAKLLCNKDKGIVTGQNRLFKLMRELNILKSDNNPYQEYLNRGYFKVTQQPFTKPNGEQGLDLITLITPQGQVKLAEKLINAIKSK
jgi:hypothetical protein